MYKIKNYRVVAVQENDFIKLIDELIKDHKTVCPETGNENEFNLNGKKYLLDDNASKILHEIVRLSVGI